MEVRSWSIVLKPTGKRLHGRLKATISCRLACFCFKNHMNSTFLSFFRENTQLMLIICSNSFFICRHYRDIIRIPSAIRKNNKVSTSSWDISFPLITKVCSNISFPISNFLFHTFRLYSQKTFQSGSCQLITSCTTCKAIRK